MNRHLSVNKAERLNSIVAMNIPLPDAAKELGVSKNQVLAWCDRLGLDHPVLPIRPIDILNANKPEVIKDYTDGDTAKEIGARLGVRREMVQATLVKWGVKKKTVKEQLYLKICEMREKAIKYADIRAELNVSDATIRLALARYGAVAPTRRSEFCDSKEEALKEFWGGGLISDIAGRYKVRQDYASKKLNEWGAVRAWDAVEQSMDRLLVKDAHNSGVSNADVDELFFIYRESLSHQVLMHWREYERLKKLAGEEI